MREREGGEEERGSNTRESSKAFHNGNNTSIKWQCWLDIPLGSGNFIYFALIKKIIKEKLHILPDLYTTQTLNIVGYGVYTHTHSLSGFSCCSCEVVQNNPEVKELYLLLHSSILDHINTS